VIASGPESYYARGDGENVSTVCARAGPAAAAELRDWLPEDHLAFFVSDLIDQLDLSAITTVYDDEERG
jgi:hypothetical protein